MFWSIVKKELKNFFRDKKGMYSFILMPIIMSFYMFGINSAVQKMSNNSGNKKEYKVNIVVSNEEANNPLVNAIKSSDGDIKFTISETKELVANKADDKSNKFNLVIELPKGFSKDLNNGNHAEIKIYKSATDMMDKKYEKISNAIDSYEKEFVNNTLTNKSIDVKVLDAYNVNMVNVGEVDTQQATMFYIVPFMLLLFPMTATMQIVNEVCITEKERGTLEAILCTRANRKTIFSAKYFTLLVLVLFEIILSFSFMCISGNILKSNLINFNILHINAILIIFVLMVLAFIFISLLQFTIGVYGKNFKETQSLLAPFTIVAALIPMAFIFLDPKNINPIFFHIPILNLVSILNELFLGINNSMHILVVVLWQVVYVIISIFITIKVISNESILFRK